MHELTPAVAGRAAGPATVVLVRHGESTWNRLGRIQGQAALAGGLTAKGWAQAAAASAALDRRLRAVASPPPLVVASDLVRARQTAAVVAARLGSSLELDPGLREQLLGALEGRRLDDEVAGVSAVAALDALWAEPEREPPCGGESVAALTGRALSTIRRLGGLATAAGRPLVAVAHGALIRSVLTSASAGAGGRRVGRQRVPNASLTAVQVDRNGVVSILGDLAGELVIGFGELVIGPGSS